MKFSVGYQLMKNENFVDEIISHKQHINEVYFSWTGFANGRNNALRSEHFSLWDAHNRQLNDMRRFSENDIKLNLLLNGNCYGKNSQSRAFFNHIEETVNYIKENFGLHSVTTTSPLIAKFLKNNFIDIEVRASVNMEIGTVQGMTYLKEYFDGFYMKREYNRDFETIKTLKNWCDSESKKLYMLANSGCLNYCSAHHFHDNLVAHEDEIAKMDNIYEFRGICKEYLRQRRNWISLLKDSNFVRPEDISLYEKYFDSVKLATRVNRNPIRVLKSYINANCHGNILELLEPAHSIYPYIIENKKLTNENLFCDKNCEICYKCDWMLQNALIQLEDFIC